MAEQIKLFFNYANTELKELENEVNDFIGYVNVIDIEVKHFLQHDIERDLTYDNFFVVVRYEDTPKMKDIVFVGIEDDGDRKGVEFYKLKDEKPCAICGKPTKIEYLEMNWDSASCNTRICADCLRHKF